MVVVRPPCAYHSIQNSSIDSDTSASIITHFAHSIWCAKATQSTSSDTWKRSLKLTLNNVHFTMTLSICASTDVLQSGQATVATKACMIISISGLDIAMMGSTRRSVSTVWHTLRAQVAYRELHRRIPVHLPDDTPHSRLASALPNNTASPREGRSSR